ncbi:cell wall hydrolase [Acutalibacter caecimuris]|uniref:cell wall hydrolase n=1 Tax=Acutalibacter caecimuris TaxID=3093657 RepID=UPI002AC8DAF8|nr:cell wall hydrolase [Acutalibacter sp. M00118]
MKRLIAVLLALALAVTGGLGASAASQSLLDYVTVTGYDPKADYTALIQRVLQDGGPYAMMMGSVYERQRNLKIDDLRLDYPKTTYFSDYSTAAEILKAIEEAKKPKPTYTEEDLDLLARIINAEAGCDWMPDWVQRMVGSVVLNRVNSVHFPNTIRDVIYQPGQYGPVYNGSIHKTPSAKVIANARYLLENGSICPANVTGQSGYITGSGLYTSYYDSVLGTTIYFCYT